MGWYATYSALVKGVGAYGSVKESLRGESDPPRTLWVALDRVSQELKAGSLSLNRAAKIRCAYWARRPGFGMSAKDVAEDSEG